MSHTRKDAPARVRRNRAAGTGAPVTHHCGHHRGRARDCDAALSNERHGRRRTCDPDIIGRADRWEPGWKSARECSEGYWAPERGAVRLSLERSRKEAFVGDVDEVVPIQQHRHGVWGGGWWD